uniref:DNA primase small subunit PriS n=1 Tax=Thermosphaera aggregans TaxID=54254 RepID=A0A7C2BKK2_9CREN
MSLREQNQSNIVLRNIIRSYYRKRPLQPPSEIHKREIALESLEDGVYLRHLSFAYMDRLYDYILSKKTPLHLYYSSALYENPSAQPMEAKGWIGSELIFDIDADKYPGCGESYYVCLKENQVYDTKPESCKGGGRPLEIPLLTWDCVTRALQDAFKLKDILTSDLGFKDVKIFFSGNRGFHVRVSDEMVLSLNSEERRLIADYVSCENIDLERVFPAYRIRREERVVFSNMEYGLRRRVKIEAEKAGILRKDRLKNEELYTISLDELSSILQSVCVPIDKVVTMDLSRLSRFVGSLNCKSGLKIVEVSDLSKFAELTYKDLSPFKGKISITPVIDFQGLPIYGNRIDLRRGVKMELDAEDALYVVLKGLAHIYSLKSLEVKA